MTELAYSEKIAGMDKFFSIFGKTALIILVIGAIAFGAFYLGKKVENKQPIFNNQQTIDNKEQLNINIQPTDISNPTIQPTVVQLKTINGGVDKKSGLSFNLYSLSVPLDWTEKRESQTPNDEKLILEKNGYQISIFQAATGGAMCQYPGDPEFEGPGSKYTIFTDLTTKAGTNVRRSGNDTVYNGKIGFTLCQKHSEGTFGQPTNYGHVSYSLPQNYNQSMLAEMDEIISSLVKK